MGDKDAGKDITCPFCFETFKDWQVHFRMEVREGNPLFEPQKDQKYEDFWSEYGGTTEYGESDEVPPYFHRVYDPRDPGHKNAFMKEDSQADLPRTVLVRDVDGMVIGARDSFGKVTTERVCPHCHNLLPGAYGRKPVKFISFIGITGAGKTVYLSQLCRFMPAQLGAYGVSVMPTSQYANDYMNKNKVVMGEKLPDSTKPEQLLQPLCFDFTFSDPDGKQHTQTFVFYDIGGENLEEKAGKKLAAQAQKFGRFILHSDALILLIDPVQFTGMNRDAIAKDDEESKGKNEPLNPTTALTVIYNLFDKGPNPNALKNIPLAVCISQADKPLDGMASNACQFIAKGKSLSDMRGAPISGSDALAFEAADYNQWQTCIDDFVKFLQKGAANKPRPGVNPLGTVLSKHYDCYNYFMIESIGVPLVKKRESSGTVYQVPDKDPTPKRIIEPILWILTILSIDGSGRPAVAVEGKINEPKGWRCPSCNKWCSDAVTFCPKCGVNKKGEWRCRKCKRLNPRSAEWCESLCCNTNRSGGSRGFFVGLFSRISRGRGA